LAVVTFASFALLGNYGLEIYRQAPPNLARVVSTAGEVLFVGKDIRDGQDVWQSIGDHELGSIWGHGAYVAPDWIADWLHREAVWLLSHWTQEMHGSAWNQLSAEQQTVLKSRLEAQRRRNACWTVNIRLSLMPLNSLLLIGPMRTWDSVKRGLRHARSAEFLQTGHLTNPRWRRVEGNTIFAAGILALGWFVAGLKFGWSIETREDMTLDQFESGGEYAPVESK
jgi:nitric oxide reductase large subunit